VREPRRHTGLASCTCEMCDLIACGAIDRRWDGWAWVDLAGYARVLMMSITEQVPADPRGPKSRWAGMMPWFSVIGQALEFWGNGDGPWA
jgi:hypothetical protein